MTPSEVEARLDEHQVQQVKIGGFDIDGVLRGKYVSREKFASVASGGLGFCDVIFGWDVADALYDNVKVTGWHSGYPDLLARVDLGTLRLIPWEPRTAAFLLDFVTPTGEDHPVSPRGVLRRVLRRAQAMGLRPRMGAEYEFFLFSESPQTLRDKGFRDLQSLTPGMFGYSWLRASQQGPLVHALLDGLRGFDVPVEGFHTETGPGVYEAAIRYGDVLEAADRAALFKTAVKEICSRHGVTACFMAKWNPALPGCSGHLHQSICSAETDANLFWDESRPHGLSDTLRHYVAGQLALMPELLALIAPTVNSYKRMVPNTWAPTAATWGIENRTTALRVIPCGPKATRVEYRLAAADINPYLAMATSLAAGLYGIEHELEPPPPVSGSGYAADPAVYPPLAPTLRQATEQLAGSAVARELLGEEFVDHYVRTRLWEARQYELAVTTWELERYLELA